MPRLSFVHRAPIPAYLKKWMANTLVYRALFDASGIRFDEILRSRLERHLTRRFPSVGWILCGDQNVGSSRIHGLNLHRYLRRQGIASAILHSPFGYVESLDVDDYSLNCIIDSHFDVVVFQRVHNGRALELIARLRDTGTLTILFVADLYDTAAISHADFLLAVSDELKSSLVARGAQAERVSVIPDAVETAPDLCKSYDTQRSDAPIKIVWTGAAGHWRTLEPIRLLLREDSRFRNYRLVTVSNHPEADVAWRLDTVWNVIMECDIGIVPADVHAAEARVKSANRITSLKALGMPVICSRLPAYTSVLKHGESGFFADSPSEWYDALLQLSEPAMRKQIGLNGRAEVFSRFGVERVGSDFLQIVSAWCEKRRSPIGR